MQVTELWIPCQLFNGLLFLKSSMLYFSFSHFSAFKIYKAKMVKQEHKVEFAAFLIVLTAVFGRFGECSACQRNHDDLCLPPDYDKLSPFKVGSKSSNKTMDVRLNLRLEDVVSIGEEESTITALTMLQLSWKDDRMAAAASDQGNIQLDKDALAQIWIPKLRVLRSTSYAPISVLNTMAESTLAKDGTISVNIWAAVTVSCDFDFTLFPHDVQNCSVVLECQGKAIVRLYGDFSTTKHRMHKSAGWKIDLVQASTEEGQFGAKVVLTRLAKGYILRCYFPAAMMVLVSWVQLFLGEDALGIRMLLISHVAYTEVKIL